MPATNPNSDNTLEVTSLEEVTSNENASAEPATSTGGDATLSAAPALNREQRRAQSKGKKGAVPGFNPLNATNPRFSSGRPANAPIQNKIPRTGHK